MGVRPGHVNPCSSIRVLISAMVCRRRTSTTRPLSCHECDPDAPERLTSPVAPRWSRCARVCIVPCIQEVCIMALRQLPCGSSNAIWYAPRKQHRRPQPQDTTAPRLITPLNFGSKRLGPHSYRVVAQLDTGDLALLFLAETHSAAVEAAQT